ncbi:MAG: bifunctional UDP-4-keto-pentose/UDP-xylose synthase [Gammaproteobacteria bacterium]|nr:bifunctional UDP-4-keto-pentose/UDP-xylose synthase [Gammaproteobacteria bacterium]
MNVFILGANGFIGSHLCEAILTHTNWHITAIDLNQDKLALLLQHERFNFRLGDITQETTWIKEAIASSDVVLPLVAIATPVTYVTNPLRVFELDFEANLAIVRLCVELQKRLIFPSTSEVYGMCQDDAFDEEHSHLVTGPVHKERWIYATSKQLLDRLIYAYGKHKGLRYTLFRPFNWYGPRLDDITNPKPGGSRVLTQFIGNVMRAENINLVNGGAQKRCFTYIDDGIAALLRIIENKNEVASNRIFNIGNPDENLSIRSLAEKIVSLINAHHPAYQARAQAIELVSIEAGQYYGEGYQDVSLRVPAIHAAQQHLQWQPTTSIDAGLRQTLNFYLGN